VFCQNGTTPSRPKCEIVFGQLLSRRKSRQAGVIQWSNASFPKWLSIANKEHSVLVALFPGDSVYTVFSLIILSVASSAQIVLSLLT
jgi:hypothetical protein